MTYPPPMINPHLANPDWAFRSDPADVEDVWGWVAISDTVEMTKVPLVDVRNNLFARLGGAAASAVLARMGARLPTVAEWNQFKAIALHIEPYVLPSDEPDGPALCREARIDMRDQVQMQRFRETHMMSKAWCAYHDAEAWRRAIAAGFTGGQAIDCIGKHWALPDAQHPAQPGHSLIYGWWTSRARSYGVHNDVMIQEPSDFHDLVYVDFATTFHGARPRTE